MHAPRPPGLAVRLLQRDVRAVTVAGEQDIAEVDVAPLGICQRLGVARSTFYRWKARFAADVDLQQWLTDQNQRLRRRVCELAADKAQLQLILRRGN